MLELSLALGKTLEELRQMPVSDFWLYHAYYQKQPFGQWRQDYNAAIVGRSLTGGSLQDLMPLWFDEQEASEDDLAVLFAGAIEI